MTHRFQVGLGTALALLLAVGCRAPSTGKAGRSLCEGTMTVTSKVEAGVVEFRAHNACSLPQLLSFEIVHPVNLDVDRAGPRLWVIPPGSTRLLATARRKDSSKRMEYNLRYSSWGGDPDARPDRSVAYAVPFGGSQARRLGQGPHSVFSHKQKFAYDFGLPEGTPVLAARDGVIYRVRDGFSKGSNDPRLASRANEVVVFHSDSTFASYAHLRPELPVRMGQKVRTGQLLGYSGSTGFSYGPHLHFEVWTRSRDGGRSTHPVRFRNGNRIVEATGDMLFEPQRSR
jgi:hypothetical protein